jgi:hypothetical protein
MKKLVYLSALAASLAAAPAFAEGGYVGASYIQSDEFFGSSDVDGFALTGAAALGDNVQLDGGFANLDDEDFDATHFGAHVFSRSPNFLWGGYVGFNTAAIGAQGFDEWTAALEGQVYLPQTTVSGALSYSEFGFSSDSEGWGIDAEVRHFFNDNFSIQGNAGYFEPEDDVITGEVSTVGFGAEYRFANTPVSLFGAWQRSDFEPGEVDSFNLGVRYNWNATLLDRDRSGPGLVRPRGFLERLAAGASPR